MSNLAKKRLFVAIFVLLVLAVIYCALAILQAASLFTGERALRNLYFWGSCMCVLLSALYCLAYSPIAQGGSRAPVTPVRPNNSFKPKPLRGSA